MLLIQVITIFLWFSKWNLLPSYVFSDILVLQSGYKFFFVVEFKQEESKKKQWSAYIWKQFTEQSTCLFINLIINNYLSLSFCFVRFLRGVTIWLQWLIYHSLDIACDVICCRISLKGDPYSPVPCIVFCYYHTTRYNSFIVVYNMHCQFLSLFLRSFCSSGDLYHRSESASFLTLTVLSDMCLVTFYISSVQSVPLPLKILGENRTINIPLITVFWTFTNDVTNPLHFVVK